MASLNAAKDTIKALPSEIQLATCHEVAKEVTRLEGARRKVKADAARDEILTATPDLTIEDADQLITWQEAREQRRGTTQPDPQ